MHDDITMPDEYMNTHIKRTREQEFQTNTIQKNETDSSKPLP